VHLVPEGLLFAADRNITSTKPQGGMLLRGQTQRPKVLKWPNREAILGYVGAGRISSASTTDWLYDFVGRHITFDDFDGVAETLTKDLNFAMSAGEVDGDLTIHLGGFEEAAGEWTPRIWFVRNTTQLTPQGPILGPRFERSEEIAQPTYFGAKTGDTIRAEITQMVKNGGLFSFRQGYDLAAFNVLDLALRQAMYALVQVHPLGVHPFPTDLEEWSKHLRMAVLGYGAYFGAFYAPFEQYVGGGADVVSVAWP
jgi:hypothetical protein